MATDDRWIATISTLTELTQTGKLRWEIDNSPLGGGIISGVLSSTTTTAHKAPYMDKWFRLRQEKAPHTLLGGPPPKYSLEILDFQGNVLFRVPETTGLQDLMESIQYQSSGVDSLIDSLLAERKR